MNTFNMNDFIENPKKYLGLIVEIDKLSVYAEVHFNEGLRCKIVGFNKIDEENESESVFELKLDFGPFEEINVPLMNNFFYDHNQVPCLKWIETPFYNDGLDSIYGMVVPDEQNSNTVFKIVGNDLIEEYFNSKESENITYVSYLENLVKELRK